MENKGFKLLLIDISTNKKFYKYFDTEFERDKFARKLRYSKKIFIIKED